MPLSVAARSVLARPSLVALLDVYLQSSLPLNLGSGPGWSTSGTWGAGAWPAEWGARCNLDAGPARWSTRDLAVTGRGMYRGRLTDKPVAALVQAITEDGELQVGAWNTDGLFNGWFRDDVEVVGKWAELYLYDADSGEISAAPVFAGRLALVEVAPGGHVSLAFQRFDPALAAAALPSVVVSTQAFPLAPATAVAPPTGGAGALLCEGFGIGLNVPARMVRAKTAAEQEPIWDAAWTGNVAVHALRVAGAEMLIGEDVDVLAREYRPNGRHVTAVRFHGRPASGTGQNAMLPIVADVERRFPDHDAGTRLDCKWAHGWRDDATGADALPGAGLTTAALTAGPGGYRLGAVAFSSTAGAWLELPDPTRFARAVFTLDLELYVTSNATGTIMHSSQRNRAGGPPKGWRVHKAAGTGGTVSISLSGRMADSAELSITAANLTLNAWHRLSFSCTSAAGATTLKVVVDGAHDAGTQSTAYGAALAYDTDAATLAAFNRSASTPDAADGGFTLGWAHFLADTARPVDDSRMLHRRLEGSPVVALADFATQVGHVVDTTSLRAQAHAFAAAFPGVRCDGWLTEPTTWATVVDAFRVFGELTPIAATNGRVGFWFYDVPTQAAVALTNRDSSMTAFRPRSLAEKIARLPVRYRLVRALDGTTGGGQFGEYQHEITEDVDAVGALGQPVGLPLVWDHYTGHRLARLMATLARVERDRLDLTAFHVARNVTRGAIVTATVDELGLAAQERRVVAVNHALSAVELATVPYNATIHAAFTPPAEYPEDPSDVDTSRLDLGDVQELQVVATGSLGVDLDVLLFQRQRLSPSGPCYLTDATRCTPQSAASIWEALAPLSSAYVSVSQGPATALFVKVAAPVDQGKTVGRVRAWFDLQKVTTGGTDPSVYAALAYKTPSGALALSNQVGPFSVGDAFNATDGTFVTYQATWELSPATSDVWTLGETGDLYIGLICAVGVAPSLRVLQAGLYVDQVVDAPENLSVVRFQRTPNATVSTPIPAEGVNLVPSLTRPFLRGHSDTAPATGEYQYVARLYDGLGRLALTLRDADATVTVT